MFITVMVTDKGNFFDGAYKTEQEAKDRANNYVLRFFSGPVKVIVVDVSPVDYRTIRRIMREGGRKANVSIVRKANGDSKK